MTIFQQYKKVIEEAVKDNYKTLRICEITKKECIEFANWIQIEGWYYGINDKYIYQSLDCKLLELTPDELFEFYKKEKKK